jgi:ketosteroid isomerase-like protein
MSHANVELAHRASDAFNRRDLDAMLALCDPEVEFVSYLMQLEGGEPYRGHEGIRSWWESLLAVYPDFTTEVEDVRGLGDLTMARLRIRGRGVESDAPIDQTVSVVAHFRQGKAIWWFFASSQASALEAARLRE